MTDLNKWAQKHRLYLKLEVGMPTTCQFKSAEEFVDKENEDREKIRYHLEINSDDKILESQSIGLAEEMAKVKKDDWIRITRQGTGRQTRYSVEVLADPDED